MTNCVDLQGYLQCTKMLYGYGYRIDGSESDQKENTQREEPDGGEGEGGILLEEQKGMHGEAEWIRQKNVIDSPYPDQVRFPNVYFKKVI